MFSHFRPLTEVRSNAGKIAFLIAILGIGIIFAVPAWSASTGDIQLEGKASWIGERFQGKKTICGDLFDMNDLVGSHATLPCGSIVKVTSKTTGKSVSVRINNRIEINNGRVIDISRRAAEQIGLIQEGVGDVSLQVISIGNGTNPLSSINPASPAAPNTPSLSTGNGNYYIQYGVFADLDNAVELRQSLKAKGILADIENITVNNKPMYRINGVQRFNTIDDAKNALIAIAPIGGIIKQASSSGSSSGTTTNTGNTSSGSSNSSGNSSGNVSSGGLEYAIQFGAFDNITNAKQRQAALLSSKNIKTIIHSFPDDERKLYRVLSDRPYTSKEEAQKSLESKGERGIILTFAQ
ncbi:MAG: septal ring lytic transglycosylase RlpA family protein [Candidatus Caenarcaniphilales bacterium]|nr:septal ring lytic transglycosylase RlpA family protein [Candidatus Caenarcaniphilales bacterium]